ncbi:MAG: ABC transporter permease [Acidimicrobiia bacterium]
MFRISLRNLWEHKLRTALLGFAVIGGVSFVVASFVFTDSLSAAFDQVFTQAQEGVDIAVVPTEENGSSSQDAFPLIDEDLGEAIASVPGVEMVRPNLQGFVSVLTDGEVGGGEFAPDFVIGWPEGPSPLELNGEVPRGDQVVVDSATAEDRGYQVGDTVEMAAVTAAQSFEIVGTFSFGTDFGLGAGFFAMEHERAAEFLGAEGKVTGFDVAVGPSADLVTVLGQVAAVLPPEAQAIDAQEAAEQEAAELQEGIGFFNTFLLVFAGVSLVVGAFVMYNAFRVVVAQRARELALLRLLGTTRRQLVGLVLGEALFVGTVASLFGVGVGVMLALGVRELLEAIGGSLPDAGLSVSPRTVVIGVVVGVLTTAVAALAPALRTTRITPLEALRDHPELRRVKPWWAIVGGLLVVASLGLVLWGISRAATTAALTGDTGPLIMVAAGCLLAFAGMFVLARTMARPLLGLLGAGGRSTAVVIGRENARRTPRRTAVTSSSLMIGVGLVVMVAVLSQSVQDTIFDALDDTFGAELLVQSSGFDPTAGIPVTVGDDVAAVEGVERIGRLSYLSIGLPSGGETLAIGVEPETVELNFKYEEVEGSFSDLGPNTLAVQRIEADTNGLGLGDQIDLEIDSMPYPATVVAIFDYEGEVSDTQSYYLAYEEVRRLQDRPLDGALSVAVEDGRDSAVVKEAIELALADYPTVQVLTLSDIIDQVRTGLNALVGMVAGLLVMSLIVAIVGIVLTLYLAVFERTRETGMLRAIGMTRRQVRRMIRSESVLIALFGTVLGVSLGLFSGWALSIGIAGTGVSFGIPWVWMVAALVGAVVTGVIAAVIPARRAARMDVLEAIAYE